MCESSVFMIKDGKEELIIENLDLMEKIGKDEFRLRNIFGEEKIVKGKIRKFSLVEHKIFLEPADS